MKGGTTTTAPRHYGKGRVFDSRQILRRYQLDEDPRKHRLNRDISNLIDAVAQNFIYDNNMYLREPAYKHVLEARELGIGAFKPRGAESLWPICNKLWNKGYNMDILDKYIERETVRTLYVDDARQERTMIAYAAAHRIGTRDLLKEIGDSQLASYIRNAAGGSIACIGFFYADDTSTIDNVAQITITEILTELISRDFAYAVYRPVDEAGYDAEIIDALELQGFVNIAPEGSEHPLYVVDMKSPIVLFKDVETVIKNPFNKNPLVREALHEAHNNLLAVLKLIYPGKLLLSFNMSSFHNKIINKVAEINGVSTVEDKKKRRGPLYVRALRQGSEQRPGAEYGDEEPAHRQVLRPVRQGIYPGRITSLFACRKSGPDDQVL